MNKINKIFKNINVFKYFLNQAVIAIILIIIAIGLAGYMGYFLYENFYLTITQSQELEVLKQEVAPDTIDIDRVNKVLDNISAKTAPSQNIDWAQVQNPFVPYDSRIVPEESIVATTTQQIEAQ